MKVYVVVFRSGYQAMPFAAMTDIKEARKLCREYVRSQYPGAKITTRRDCYFTEFVKPGENSHAWVQTLKLDDTQYALNEIATQKRISNWK